MRMSVMIIVLGCALSAATEEPVSDAAFKKLLKGQGSWAEVTALTYEQAKQLGRFGGITVTNKEAALLSNDPAGAERPISGWRASTLNPGRFMRSF